jgi:hypothetical protein
MGYITYEKTNQASGDDADVSVKIQAVLKVASLFSFLILLAGYLYIRKTFFVPVNQVSLTNSFGKIEFRVPYKNTLYENFGFVQDPKITLPLKTVRGYENTTFLLDSGAVVSTMPLQAAEATGVDLAKAKRITLQGFSGVPAFAYLDKVTIKIGDQDYELPATFTESTATSYILGRKGLFDDFTINFDHEQRAITISRKSGA